MNEYKRVLVQHQLRDTKQRQAVFLALKQADHPLKLSEIAERCPGVDRSSVYRAIDIFMTIDVVKVVPIGWKKKYELTELFHPHHHHLRCTACLRMLPIADERLERAIEDISLSHNFQPTNHHFEIEGLCQRCQAGRETAQA